ncbi:hypothetical protein L3Y34_007149 [Caenorhabditis briggsae]|uniref:DUF38 domain-containing protein n=1 Tax=Caenorhabditis briggsae TaxID=6238 RepID=A0AAE9A614_CAEBR|nr:hypothetical protein L3Y34_007149 [Caenorhabditis briggsae]
MESFWQYLSEIFRILVIQKLDFKSRCCLRKCSKICHGTSRKGMEILVETEQWRSLKKFSFGEIENVDVNWLLNLERIRFSVGKFLVEDIWILVQNFLNKNYPIQSYVDIYLTENADVNNMLMFLEEQNVIVKNEPISERFL